MSKELKFGMFAVGVILLIAMVLYMVIVPGEPADIAGTDFTGEQPPIVEPTPALPEPTTPAEPPAPIDAPPTFAVNPPTTQPNAVTVAVTPAPPATTQPTISVSGAVGGITAPADAARALPNTGADQAPLVTGGQIDWTQALTTGRMAGSAAAAGRTPGATTGANPAVATAGTTGGAGSWDSLSLIGSAPAGANNPASTFAGRTNTVRTGETVATIAERYYGSQTQYPRILRANPNLDPRRLRVGQTIKIPALNDATAASATTGGTVVGNGRTTTTGAATPANGSTYTVQPGDSLQRIARKLYGNPERWERIYEANRQQIGRDPHRLRAGMTLRLPEAPTTAAR